jgi:hypothetical protein
MSDVDSALPGWVPQPSVRFLMRVCLFSQIAIGGAIIADQVTNGDLFEPAVYQPSPTQPVAPGDQTRRFDPRKIPTLPGDERPRGPVLLPDTMADIKFTYSDTEEFGRVMLVSGPIQEGDSDRFEIELAEQAEKPQTVALHSPGGAVAEALRMGRLIRDQGLNTMIAPDAVCNSACPLILFGGVERIVSRQGWVGMHQAYLGKDTFLTSRDTAFTIQALQAEVMSFISDMGVDPLVLAHAMATPPEDIYYLLPEQLENYHVATRITEESP